MPYPRGMPFGNIQNASLRQDEASDLIRESKTPLLHIGGRAANLERHNYRMVWHYGHFGVEQRTEEIGQVSLRNE